ncbi:MAG: type II secretion system GspH family protein [Acidobacteriota bacterium]|nr:type II secretion system GspH family protein [Acidobacteriota bacterium]
MTEASRRGGCSGFTLVELMCVIFLLTILAGIALPVAHTMERRARELELRQELRKMRRAIDSYHFTIEAVPGLKEQQDATAEGWPDDLDVLVDGLDLGQAAEIKVKFLRRIPKDPLTGDDEWGKRSHKQDPDDDLWDGTSVYDVFTTAEGDGLDGTPYSEW